MNLAMYLINVYLFCIMLLSCFEMSFHICLGNTEISIVQISFDGNCSWNPPCLMDKTIFEKLKNATERNFASYINIIYTDAFHFIDCDINELAAETLKALSYMM